MIMNEPQWAIAYHTNSRSTRARRWYRVSRLIEADGQWFELYWHEDNAKLASASLPETRKRALASGIKLMAGTWRNAPSPRRGDVMERAL